MPLLIAVPPCLVAFVFYKANHKAISIPVDMQHMCMNNIFQSCHEIPLKTQKSTCKKKLFTFLPQKQPTNLFVNITAQLLLTNNTYIPLVCLLGGNVLPDALRELLEILEGTELHGILAHAEEMLKRNLGLLVRQVLKTHCLPLISPSV
jgi:hypothetical protein